MPSDCLSFFVSDVSLEDESCALFPGVEAKIQQSSVDSPFDRLIDVL